MTVSDNPDSPVSARDALNDYERETLRIVQLRNVLKSLNTAHGFVTDNYDETLGHLLDAIDEAIELAMEARP